MIITALLIISIMLPISGCGGEAEETTVTSVSPGSAKVGETLDVTITGTNLTGASAVSFGSGIIFRGEGFHCNDYRKKEKPKKEEG